ncbi:MAG TPA: phage portal protein [Lachnospiraceae bacterium]|nr:phage portal protein [Lachnospiraceae bacterium]
MSKLAAFLKPSPAGKTKEVRLARFTDENGEIVPFVIKSIAPEESEKIAKKCRDKKGNLDKTEYGNQLIVACMVEPDLRDEELCKFYGVMDPNMVPGRMFSIGEKNVISDAIMEINDFGMEQEKLDEAKNS